MVYESDFYTTRRSRPSYSTYSVTTPRYYTVRDEPSSGVRRADQQYTYSYNSTQSSSNSSNPYSRPETTSYSSTVERKSRAGGGAGDYNYTTERSSTTGSGPGGYSYSSTTSGRLPHGTGYRHYSYRV